MKLCAYHKYFHGIFDGPPVDYGDPSEFAKVVAESMEREQIQTVDRQDCDICKDSPVYMGVDFGSKDHSVVVFATRGPEDSWKIIDAIHDHDPRWEELQKRFVNVRDENPRWEQLKEIFFRGPPPT